MPDSLEYCQGGRSNHAYALPRIWDSKTVARNENSLGKT